MTCTGTFTSGVAVVPLRVITSTKMFCNFRIIAGDAQRVLSGDPDSEGISVLVCDFCSRLQHLFYQYVAGH